MLECLRVLRLPVCIANQGKRALGRITGSTGMHKHGQGGWQRSSRAGRQSSPHGDRLRAHCSLAGPRGRELERGQ